MISLIVAFDKNLGIGKNNKLCWRQSNDLKRFKELTLGHTVVMGRKTFESIGKPLPGRKNIVITRQNIKIEGVEIINSLEDLKKINEEVFIIGGGEIYKSCIILANKIYVTKIDCEIDADTWFPELDDSWIEVSRESHAKDSKNEYNYTFVNYERR